VQVTTFPLNLTARANRVAYLLQNGNLIYQNIIVTSVGL